MWSTAALSLVFGDPLPLVGPSADPVDFLPPAPALLVQPRHPGGSTRERGDVCVGLLLEIDSDGTVSAVRVTASAGDLFDRLACNAARSFVFRPALRGGRPVAARLRYAVSFRS
jgi:TonB family protein